jgi:FOG: PKD repeat
MKFKYFVLLFLALGLIVTNSSAQFKADFHVNRTFGCVPLTGIDFTANCTPSDSVTYSWDLGNGNTSILQNPSATYNAVGTFTVKLTATRNGVVSSKDTTIRVFSNPVANFSTVDNITKGCAPFRARFSNTSTPASAPINSYTWIYGDGNSDGQSTNEVDHDYTGEGVYGVSLFVVDTNGCSSTKAIDKYIDVANPPQVSFYPVQSFVCSAPATIKFISESKVKGKASYQWIMGNSASIDSFANFKLTKYDTTYNIKLTVTDLTYNTNGTCFSEATWPYTITLVKANGTITQGAKTINSSGSIVCAGSIKLESHSIPSDGGIAWIYDKDHNTGTFDSITHYDYHQSGAHTVWLISNPGNECADTLKWYFTVEKVNSGFSQSPAASCQPSQIVSFSNTSSANAVSYLWKFADGTTSTSTNPSSITYSLPKDLSIYDIHSEVSFPTQLLATSSNGCSDSVTNYLTIKRPTALFSADTIIGCAPLKVNFSDKSMSDSAIVSHKWIFGDGNFLQKTTETTASYQYDTPGTYDASLVITNKENCVDTSYNVQIKVGASPGADFAVSPSTVCQSDSVFITDQSSGSPDYWFYTMNGMAISSCPSEKNASFVRKYDVGTITIKQVVGSNGCYSSTTKTITNKGPVASFTFQIPDCASPYNYQFTSTHKSAGTAILDWDFGDGTAHSSSASPTHTFPATPENTDYRVKLTVQDNGCTDTASQIVRVRKSIVTFAAPVDGCAFLPIKFNATGSQPLSTLCHDKYVWSFGDTTPDIRTVKDSVFHTFIHGGIYKVQLSAIHDNGCVDVASKNIQIFRPRAILTSNKTGGCPGTAITFTDKSVPDVNPISTVFLNYDDGKDTLTTLSGKSYKHVYIDQNVYNPYLKIVDSRGCYDSTTVDIGIEQPVVTLWTSLFPNRETCVNLPITFYQTAQEVDSMRWTFDDGTRTIDTSNIASIIHTFTTEKRFDVKVRVYKYGCPDSTVTSVFTQKADASFSVSPKIHFCPNEKDTITVFKHLHPGSSIVYGEWDTGDKKFPYNTSDTIENVMKYFYKKSGIYKTQLTILTSYGCTDTKVDTVRVLGPVAQFDLSAKQSCKKTPITFTMKDTANIGTFYWDFGDGNFDTSGASEVTHQYIAQGPKYVSLVLNNLLHNCQTSLPDTINIDGVTAQFSVKDTAGCTDIPIAFTNSSAGGNSQDWNFTDGPISNEVSPEHTYTSSGTYPVTLVVYSPNACTDTAKRVLTIGQTPLLSVRIDSCSNKKAHLQATTSGNYVNWWPAKGLSDSTSFEPIASPDFTTLYKVRATNSSGGCTKTDSILIIKPNARLFGRLTKAVDTIAYLGQPIKIQVTDTSSIKAFRWEPATYLNSKDSLSPIASPLQSIAYSLILDDPNNCFTDTSVIRIFVKADSLANFQAPTAFKPGGDANNNKFYIVNHAPMNLIDFKIYNRWGNVVFESHEGMEANGSHGYRSVEGWDGKYQGKDQPIDTYIWVATAIMYSDKGEVTVKKTGTLILLR